MTFELISIRSHFDGKWVGWFEGMEHIVCYADERELLPMEIFKSMGTIAHYNLTSTTCNTERHQGDRISLHKTTVRI